MMYEKNHFGSLREYKYNKSALEKKSGKPHARLCRFSCYRRECVPRGRPSHRPEASPTIDWPYRRRVYRSSRDLSQEDTSSLGYMYWRNALSIPLCGLKICPPIREEPLLLKS
uniref:Uncharacterized protein n=1 Tax=uncultured Choricystis TaxID=858337 RepID=A0A346HG55_9CHLO|nr:hypothetical protein [uncultured Choricystis]